MKQFIGCDAHKRYWVLVAVGEDWHCGPERKVLHTGRTFEAFLEDRPEGSEIALEACSSYYWMVAVARRRAEAAYWILKKREVYREPEAPRWEVSSTHG